MRKSENKHSTARRYTALAEAVRPAPARWMEPLELRTLMSGNGLTGMYYNNSDFTGLAQTRTDATVNFYWGAGAPAASMGSETFSARWTGQVETGAAGEYTFYTRADDGVRLWVDGKLVVDDFSLHAAREASGKITLAANTKYDIKMEYYEHTGLATASLSWSGPTTAKQVIPQSRLYSAAVDVTPAPTVVQAVTKFTLMNADTNQALFELKDGATIDYAKLPTRNLSVRAETNGTVGSVMFGLDGDADYHNENNAPYSLTGAVGDDYTAWSPLVGSHTLTATPYSDYASGGEKGNALTITFKVVDSGAVIDSPTPTPAPVPAPAPDPAPVPAPAPAPSPAPSPSPTPAPTPGGVTYEYKLVAGQSLSSIAPKPGDDILLSGNWSKISVPWSGTASAPIHIWFADGSTVGNGQSGTVFQGGTYLDIHELHVTGVTNGLQVANAAAKVGTGTTVSDSLFENTTGTGLGIQGNDITVQRTTFQRNGQQGFVIIFSNNVVLKDSKILNNNPGLTTTPPWAGQVIEGYTASYNVGGKWYVNPDFEAGGNKIWASNNVRLENNEAAYNVGPGLWTDYKNTNITMVNNWCHHNRGVDAARSYQGEGIRLELSPSEGGFNIRGNRLEYNSGAGITLTSIRDVDIVGNTLVGGIGILFRNDDGRGGLNDISITGNTFDGASITTWGNRYPMTGIVTSPNSYV